MGKSGAMKHPFVSALRPARLDAVCLVGRGTRTIPARCWAVCGIDLGGLLDGVPRYRRPARWLADGIIQKCDAPFTVDCWSDGPVIGAALIPTNNQNPVHGRSPTGCQNPKAEGRRCVLPVLIDADNAQAAVIEGFSARSPGSGGATVKRIYGDFTSPDSARWKRC